MPHFNRREALVTLLAAPALPALGAEPAPGPSAPRQVRPLPFDPKKLKGLSEKLIVSHHDNNYAAAVKNLARVEEDLARANKDTPGPLVYGLKERELTFRNSITLHEAYFENLGGDGKPGGAIEKAVARSFGSYPRFEETLRSCAMSLAGGSGWTVLSLQLGSDELRVDWSSNHSQALAGAWPLLVLDMYEHAYAIDYGAAAAKYLDAFMANVKWDVVDRRYAAAQKAAA